jgi:hypothetical protein
MASVLGTAAADGIDSGIVGYIPSNRQEGSIPVLDAVDDRIRTARTRLMTAQADIHVEVELEEEGGHLEI